MKSNLTIEPNFRVDTSSQSKPQFKLVLISIVSVILLFGMALTIMVSPAVGPSLYELKLEEGENRMKKVTASPSGSTTYDITLSDIRGEGAGTGEIRLEIADASYYGGSEEGNWDFEFMDAEPDDIYYIEGSEVVSVTLKVSFLGSVEGEKVTFTIAGYNTTSNDIETHLSPYDGFNFESEFLTVFTGEDCEVFWEPTTTNDRLSHYLLLDNSYQITIWNLGTNTDTLSISDWEVWQDVDKDGIIDGGAGDILNEYFEIEFYFLGGESNDVGEPIILDSMTDEYQRVIVIPDDDREKVPEGHYLIKITVNSECNDEHTDTLKAQIDPAEFIDKEIRKLEDILNANPDLDKKVKKDIERAIDDLDPAKSELSDCDMTMTIHWIENAIKDLMKAYDAGVDTKEVIENLIGFVVGITENIIVDSRLLAEDENDWDTLDKAIDYYESGLNHVKSESWNKAVPEFRKAVNEAMKIIE